MAPQAKPKSRQRRKKLLHCRVTWNDAVAGSKGWHDLSALNPETLGHNLCHSTGYLLGERDGYVILASDVGAWAPELSRIIDGGRFMSIPVGWVVSMVTWEDEDDQLYAIIDEVKDKDD